MEVHLRRNTIALLALLPAVMPAERTFTTAAPIRALRPEQAAQRLPVRLRAVVTYYDPYIDPRHQALFLNEATGPIFAALPGGQALPIRAGDLVEVSGVTGPGDFAPIVADAQVKYLGRAHLPVARRVGMAELLTGADDAQWIEIEGVVHAVQIRGRNVLLEIAMSDGTIHGLTVAQPGVDYMRLIDAAVRLRGACGLRFNHNRQLTGAQIFFPGIDQLQVIERAPDDPYSQPVRSAGELLSFTPGIHFLHRVHMRGAVTLFWPGKTLCIQQTSGQGLCMPVAQQTHVRLGEMVDVLGFPVPGEYTPSLVDATFRPAASQVLLPWPQQISPEQALQGNHDAQLVRIDGSLVGRDRTGDEARFVLSAGGFLFPLVLPASKAPPAWREGSVLRVTGICSVQTDRNADPSVLYGFATPTSFRILLRSPRDVTVIRQPSWWTVEHSLSVVGVVLALAFSALAWVGSLRIRVARQTRVIRAQLATAAELRDAAEAASRAKSDFLANMSHEIRTPLNAVVGFSRLALERCSDREQRDFLNTTVDAAHSLLGIINDVLDFSKIEAQRLQLEEVPFELPELLRASVRCFEPQAHAKNLTLSVELPDDIPHFVAGDPTRLRQTLVNLLSNAIKFTSVGSVTCRAELAARLADAAEVHFSVSDTGIGIPPERQAAIFDAFEQVDTSTTRKYGGTGLGLTICARLTELAGGKIWVESRPGEGSTFHFTLPLRLRDALDAKPTAATAASPIQRLSILAAEDNAMNQKLITKLLEKMGHQVTLAADGEQACSAAKSRAFDLILMDVQMPNMSGLEATRIIRDWESQGSRRTPIIALTATASADDRKRCLEAGMDSYLTKPVQLEQLQAEIARAMHAMQPALSA